MEIYSHKYRHTKFVKKMAADAGFDFCGISKAEFLHTEAPRLEKWLKSNMHGDMYYMENHFDKRLDPRLLVDGAKSVISLLYNYYPESEITGEVKISKYAYGEDYHIVIKDKLYNLVHELQEEIGNFSYRIFVDSAPVLEKAWAAKSGLGWIGKNSNLINKNSGSFYFLAEIICDLEFDYDGPIKDYCGTCTKCIDACPTEAITEPYVVDGSKCISYLTIELKDNIPNEFKGKMDGWVFGCDICQDVCPWNRFSKAHGEAKFSPIAELQGMVNADIEKMTEDTFKKIFKNSPVKRTKLSGLVRNYTFLKD